MSEFETAKKVFMAGLEFLDSRDYANAELKFRDALELLPKNKSILTNLSVALLALGKLPEAQSFAEQAILLDAKNLEAYSVLASCLAKQENFSEALPILEKIIAIDPNLPDIHNNRGIALNELQRCEEAISSYDRAIALQPNFADAHRNRAATLSELGRYDQAAAGYDMALALDPAIEFAEGARLHAKMHACDWRGFDAHCSGLLSALRKGAPVSAPFIILSIASNPSDQLSCAKIYAADKYPPAATPLWQGEVYRHDPIRIAYLSADLHDHATAYLIAGLFEHHDKSRFETTAISFGPERDGEMRRRLKRAVSHFIDVRSRSDQEIAELVRTLEIDIEVDLKGFTQGARPGVFARRPAPIQVGYIGYPGTMGAGYIDYLIADRIVVLDDARQFYSECVVHLPDSYQVNDSSRPIAQRTPARAEESLPEKAFVFCSFNNNYKITPDIFDVWMRLLQNVEGSVLWLFEANSIAPANLRREAQMRGISADRLIFAQRTNLADHLARHRLADLFLDTHFYNAHTTASDALWAGLPVVTRIGSTFAGRVAGSLLNAVGLPELIAHSLEDYEALALTLARDPALLASFKERLARNRAACPLFDTARFTRHLEAAYTTMWERYQRGEAPAGFAVAPVT